MTAYSDAETTVTVLYRNHRGEVAERQIVPLGIRFGECEWHPGPQWLLECRDVEKDAHRTFAMKDILAWAGRAGT